MDDKDLKQFRELLREEFAKGFAEGFGQIWEHNLEPAFNAVDDRIDVMDGKISQLPSKAYLDDKLANLEGGLVAKLRKEDEKVNRLAEMLKNKKVLTEMDLKELGNLQVFPK